MFGGERKIWTLLCGLLIGTLSTHFVHLATRTADSAPTLAAASPSCATVQSHLMKPPVQLPQLRSTPSAELRGQQQRTARSNIPEELHHRVRILCLIMTHPGNYDTKAVAVNNTWARRCNRYVFVGSNATKTNIPLMRLNITESRDNLWQKTWMSLESAASSFNLEDFDFVLKADDDTYVVMENLRLLLLPLDPSKPSHTGRVFQYNGDPALRYMSGGASYVLSRRAMQLFLQLAVRSALKDPCARQRHFSEDFMLGRCLHSIGVKFIDSRDASGLDRFHPLSPGYMIGWGPAPMPEWMQRFNYYKFKVCTRGCVSRLSVAFHYISLMDMYKMEFLLYELRPVSIDNRPATGQVSMAAEVLGKLGKS